MDEPLILAIETSSRVGSVALARGARLLAEHTFAAPLQHSAEVVPAIRQLLNQADLAPYDISHVYIADGPGSFTGLRIAVTIAKAMHLANGTAIVTVNSLDVIAANIGDATSGPSLQDSGTSPPDLIATVFDAKRGEFYAAMYQRLKRSAPFGETNLAPSEGYVIPAPQGCSWHKTVPDCLITADQLVNEYAVQRPLGVLGDGLLYHRAAFRAKNVRLLDEVYWSPRAANVYRLGYQKAQAGLFADALTLAPFYLRGPQVTIKKSGIL
ncbi:MAG: tRNA (adenosine(37)-N6)-threonylcarbamoyltransferase complex dimerization subunit type 1 TsaB [Sedimentisphaerales bacterium]|nr:tRNA (adenosine(37)-N6)-threonylcarbamoyltransferase complex dimerization subunit type 1 TsaB [Sedimentisphaerales bacterium]